MEKELSKLEEIISVLPESKLKAVIDFARYLKMKISRGNVVLYKVPMPSEELRKFKPRPGIKVLGILSIGLRVEQKRHLC